MATCIDELDATLASDGRYELDQHAALVGLCKLLARQIDSAGDGASTRLTAAYLSALKDLAKVTATGSATPAKKDGGESGGTTLGSLRSIAGGKSA